MKDRKSNLLLVLGCQRSGTSLLASMLGGHSEINMLYESTGKDVLKLIGKKYSGNKLLLWRQIRKEKRASKFGHLVNRIVNFGSKTHKIRPYPTSKMSIDDYVREGAKIVMINRNHFDIMKSIVSRTKMSNKQAENEIRKSIREKPIIAGINISYEGLVKHPQRSLVLICEYLGLQYEERMLEGTEYNFAYPHKGIKNNLHIN